MTDLRTAAQQALEALETVFMPHHPAVIALRAALAEEALQRLTDANQEIEAALEQPEQEPVAEWLTGCPGCGMDGGCDCDEGTCNPPRREWRGLSKDESLKLWGMRSDGPSNTEITSFARAIEAALKEKNYE
jgi:hypothetical protein